jgi:hypothetical protein
MFDRYKVITDPEKTLYHFTDRENALEIVRDGVLKPSPPYQHLSINENGKFDGRDLKQMNFGYSSVPNIYFVDHGSPASVISIGQNISQAECRFEVTVGEIMRQGFKVFRPWPMTWFVYNVPCPDSRTLKVDVEKIKHFQTNRESLQPYWHVFYGLILYAPYKSTHDFLYEPLKKRLQKVRKQTNMQTFI